MDDMDDMTPFESILLTIAQNEDRKLSNNQLAKLICERLTFQMNFYESDIKLNRQQEIVYEKRQ